MQFLLLRFQKLFYVSCRPLLWLHAFKGIFPSVEHSSVVNHMLCDNDIDYLVDVGFNKGQFCLLTLEKRPSIRVVAFDPHPSSPKFFRLISRVFGRSSQDLKFFNCALATTQKTLSLKVPTQWDSSSLLSPTPTQSRLFGTSTNFAEYSVNCHRLDSFLISRSFSFHAAILKIDVQGFELDVLHGAVSILGKFKYILIELSFVELYANQAKGLEVINFITSHGFCFVGSYNHSYDGIRLVQADFCFKRSL